MHKALLHQLFSFLLCLLVLVAVAINTNEKILGHRLTVKTDSIATEQVDTMQLLSDGTHIINTTPLTKNVQGYAGPVPLRIYIKEGKIQKVEALNNSETPDFFEMASTLLTRWNGKTLDEALHTQVDAVSGATFSSKAIIINMQRGLQYARQNVQEKSIWQQVDLSPGSIAALIVVLMGALIPLFVRNKHYLTVQLILNVVVLGLWSGTFISFSLIVNYLSNGTHLLSSIVPLIMLVTAFIYPFFGKKNYYCTHICPCGSLQDLAGRATHHKWKMSKQMVRALTRLRKILFALLILLLLTGVWASWMNYEIFIAFIFRSASWVVLALAAVFMILSIWVPRPYCRFVCPTGSLIKVAQSSKD